MTEDNRGQVSFEYLLIMAVSLIILIAFTIPLSENVIQTTLDVSDSLDVKSDLSKISSAIKTVYSEGQGSKQTVNLQSRNYVTVNILGSYIYCDLKLHEGHKIVKVSCKSNLEVSDIHIKKGENTVIVEWPIGNENMLIYTE